MKNPFNTLGLSQALVKKFNRTQLTPVITSQYRALSALYHPDQSLMPTKNFIELGEAWAEIGRDADDDSFAYWRAQHLRTLKEQKEEAKAEYDHLKTLYDILCARYADHLIAQAIPDIAETISICSLRMRRFIVGSIGENVRHRFYNGRECSTSYEHKMYELFVKDARTMWRRRTVRVRNIDEAPPKDLPLTWKYTSTVAAHDYWWNPDGPFERLEGMTMVGALDTAELRRQSDSMYKSYMRLPGYIPGSEIEQSGIPWGMFLTYLPFLCPNLGVGRILIGIRQPERIELLGNVLRESRLSRKALKACEREFELANV